MLIPLLIPVVILVICVIAFLVLRRAFEGYFKGMEERSNLLQRVLYLVMTKDIVSFFASPEANKIVDILYDEGQTGKEDIEDKLLESVQSAGPEIERLYASLRKAYEPSASMFKAKSASMLLRLNILLYGIAVSISEFVEVYYYYVKDMHSITFMNGLIFGGTIIFAMLLVSMSLYIYFESGKITRHVKNLTDPSSMEAQAYTQ